MISKLSKARGMSRILLEDKQPMIFGPDNNFGLILDGFRLKAVEIDKDYTVDDLLVHDVKDKNLANLISEMTYDEKLPVPFGVVLVAYEGSRLEVSPH